MSISMVVSKFNPYYELCIKYGLDKDNYLNQYFVPEIPPTLFYKDLSLAVAYNDFEYINRLINLSTQAGFRCLIPIKDIKHRKWKIDHSVWNLVEDKELFNEALDHNLEFIFFRVLKEAFSYKKYFWKTIKFIFNNSPLEMRNNMSLKNNIGFKNKFISELDKFRDEHGLLKY